VARFLGGGLAFSDIADVVERTVAKYPHETADDLDQLLATDAQARVLAEQQALSLV
jgi:1-deoxy-D-xylulose-5-phosphate reductoisomerase